MSNQDILKAIKDLEADLSTSDLGHHLYKVRIKRTNSGKSKGFRTIIVYKQKDRSVFLYGFGKNEKANITKSELKYFKKLSDDFLALTFNQLKKAIDQKILFDLEETT